MDMLRPAVWVTVIAAAGVVSAAPGAIIASFALTGQPAQGVRGLAYDWSDDDVWAAGPVAANNVRFAKFDPVTRSVLSSWNQLPGMYWVYDLGFGYQIGGNRYFVALDQYTPRMRLFTTAGSYYGSMPDPFSLGYDEGVDCDWGGTYVYASNYNSAAVYRWRGSSWEPWAQVEEMETLGVACGWGRVFVLTSETFKIFVFNQTTGSLMQTISISGFTTHRPVGMSIGRVDASAAEESVFIAVWSPAALIYEVSVGNITANALGPASWGKLKAIYY